MQVMLDKINKIDNLEELEAVIAFIKLFELEKKLKGHDDLQKIITMLLNKYDDNDSIDKILELYNSNLFEIGFAESEIMKKWALESFNDFNSQINGYTTWGLHRTINRYLATAFLAKISQEEQDIHLLEIGNKLIWKKYKLKEEDFALFNKLIIFFPFNTLGLVNKRKIDYLNQLDDINSILTNVRPLLKYTSDDKLMSLFNTAFNEDYHFTKEELIHEVIDRVVNAMNEPYPDFLIRTSDLWGGAKGFLFKKAINYIKEIDKKNEYSDLFNKGKNKST